MKRPKRSLAANGKRRTEQNQETVEKAVVLNEIQLQTVAERKAFERPPVAR